MQNSLPCRRIRPYWTIEYTSPLLNCLIGNSTVASVLETLIRTPQLRGATILALKTSSYEGFAVDQCVV